MLRRNLVVIGFTCLIFFTALLYIQYLVGDGNILVPFPWKEDPFQKYRTKEYQESLLKWYNYSNGNLIINLPSMKMDDPTLISSIRSRFLIPPSTGPYHLKEPEVRDPSMGQSAWIRRIFRDRRNGFFVEAGALDGETRSNTLFFEKELGWKGLLVEADPYNFGQLLNRNRKAWSTPTCLSTQPYPMMVSFKQEENMGKISDRQIGSPIPGFVDVQCFPLYSLLLAMNVTTVDYFSLDVEGSELEVLKTIPFDKIDIKALSVEFIHGPLGKEVLQAWMEKKGYKVIAEVTHPNWLANDFIFFKESMLWSNKGNLIINLPSMKMDDPTLISSIRSRFLIPPSTGPYHLKEPEVRDPSMGQSAWIRRIFRDRRNGFFVEAGALDGETRSNTLFFEKELGWKGLLVEADPDNFVQLLNRNRKAWSTPTCLSTQPYPMMVSFKQEENIGKISDRQIGSPIPGFVDVQCFPLYSLLLAMNVTTVDYFSLDVEGSELEVLKTIPFDKIDIKALSVEFIHGPLGKEVLQAWMEKKGYKVIAEVTHPNWLANDFIFFKESMLWSNKGDEVR